MDLSDGEVFNNALFAFTPSGTVKATAYVAFSAAPADADTVTVNGKVYTFKDTLTPSEGQILIDGQDGSLLNLLRAINHTGTPGTDYSVAVIHPTVTASESSTEHRLDLTAKTGGTGGNSLTLAESGSGTSVSGANFTGGLGTVAEVDFSDHIQSIKFMQSRAELDNTVMGMTSKSRKGGLLEWSFQLEMLQDFSSMKNIDSVIYEALNSNSPGTVRFRPFNASIGADNPEYTGRAMPFSHQIAGGKVGDLLTTPPEFKSAGNLTRSVA